MCGSTKTVVCHVSNQTEEQPFDAEKSMSYTPFGARSFKTNQMAMSGMVLWF